MSDGTDDRDDPPPRCYICGCNLAEQHPARLERDGATAALEDHLDVVDDHWHESLRMLPDGELHRAVTRHDESDGDATRTPTARRHADEIEAKSDP